MHPAKVASTKKNAAAASQEVTAAPIRESPRRKAKSITNDRIVAQLLPHEHIPVAVIVSKGAEIDPTVTAQCGAEESPKDLPAKRLNIPPLWNVWYSS